MTALTREQTQRVDRLAAENLGIPSVVLMENAAINATAVILDELLDGLDLTPSQARVAVVCGGGNNGGDGYAIARHLHNWGVDVALFAVKNPDELDGDAAINHRVCHNMGLPIAQLLEPPAIERAFDDLQARDLLVDAILGTGFHGQPRAPIDTVLAVCDRLDHPAVVAIDVPSGLDCDTGEPCPHAIRADLTITFVERKVGFDQPAAAPHLGRVVVADIGIPPELIDRVRTDAAFPQPDRAAS